ncbi:MAG TPA: bestrophin family protein [Cyclobacteriaceae bacterium]
MIKYNPKSWFSLIFDVYSRYVIKSLWPLIIFIFFYTLTLCIVTLELIHIRYEGTLAFHSILGVILGLFLVLRTNTAYDRWWEGRKLWGALVNDTRNLALKISAFVKSDKDRLYFKKMIPNVVFAMKEHLRDSILIGEMDFVDNESKEEIKQSNHRPNIINRGMYKMLTQFAEEGKITGEQFFVVDKELKGFTDIIGKCERIKTTPIPYSYSMFIKKFIFMYTITLPIGFVWEFGYWTIPIVLIIFYFLVSIELIAEEIEDPFGMDLNDLPLNELATKIKRNVYEILS